MENALLRAFITKAFSLASPPSPPVTTPDLDDENELEPWLADRKWSDCVGQPWMNEVIRWQHWIKGDAYHYYLPAILSHLLLEPDRRTDYYSNVLDILAQSDTRRLGGLSHAERCGVHAFVNHAHMWNSQWAECALNGFIRVTSMSTPDSRSRDLQNELVWLAFDAPASPPKAPFLTGREKDPFVAHFLGRTPRECATPDSWALLLPALDGMHLGGFAYYLPTFMSAVLAGGNPNQALAARVVDNISADPGLVRDLATLPRAVALGFLEYARDQELAAQAEEVLQHVVAAIAQ